MNPVDSADICLILEGTYPFVRGGVSTWVHQLLTRLPHLNFSLVFIGSAERDYQGSMYVLPPNVCHLEVHYLEQLSAVRRSGLALAAQGGENSQVADLIRALVEQCVADQVAGDQLLQALSAVLRCGSQQLLREFRSSAALWDYMVECYGQYCPDFRFSHYFWTLRSMFTPLLGLLAVAEQLPQAHCYHVVSTGYAGMLGVYLRLLHNKPLLLTEHGIYTRERKIDLYRTRLGADEQLDLPAGLSGRYSPQRQMWVRLFEVIGLLTYHAAVVTLSLYEASRRSQISYGAPARRCKVIPNGVRISDFAPLRDLQAVDVPPVLGLIGRVVRIKDIKAFIESIRILQESLPGVQGWIVGPEDEDPAYAQDCRLLVQRYGLEKHIRFLGFQRVQVILPQLGLLVLTSISESQPLVLLEGFAAGVPAVTTDVGSCRELIEGGIADDRRLGRAGAVVPLGRPDAFAAAARQLLTDPLLWHAARQAAIRRVERYYSEAMLLRCYGSLYLKMVDYGRHRV